MVRRRLEHPGPIAKGCLSAFGLLVLFGFIACLALIRGGSVPSWAAVLIFLVVPTSIGICVSILSRDRQEGLTRNVRFLEFLSTKLRRRGRLQTLDHVEELLQRREIQLVQISGKVLRATPESRHIPEDTKLEVIRRDGLHCRGCGVRQDLQFDHILPFSGGGKSVARNLQLLCGQCNRRKSDRIPGSF